MQSTTLLQLRHAEQLGGLPQGLPSLMPAIPTAPMPTSPSLQRLMLTAAAQHLPGYCAMPTVMLPRARLRPPPGRRTPVQLRDPRLTPPLQACGGGGRLASQPSNLQPLALPLLQPQFLMSLQVSSLAT